MKRFEYLYIFAMTLMFFKSAFAQVLWPGTEAGMSPTQVISAIPEAIRYDGPVNSADDGSVQLLQIKRLEILDLPFRVSFFFKEERLRQVNLSLSGISDQGAERAVQKVLPTIREKYGKEEQEDQRGKNNFRQRMFKWRQQGTEISLVLINFGIDIAIFLYFIYRGVAAPKGQVMNPRLLNSSSGNRPGDSENSNRQPATVTPLAQAERQRQATRPGLAVRGTFSPALVLWLAAVACFARTLCRTLNCSLFAK